MTEPQSLESFRAAVAQANHANEELLAGRSGPLVACFSHRADASVLGGFGGHELGWKQLGPRLEWVGETFAGGHCEYEELSIVVGSDLAYVVQLERGEARIKGRAGRERLELRVTMVFRREDGQWKLVHRHADPLVQKKAPT
jgi:hypothetical protein